MKATPLLVSWHNENAPIYSAHFEPHGKARLATAGGDNNVRLWKVEASGDERKVIYLSTLVKHTQAVNVVRWSPRGEILGSAGDDGNILLWVPAENQSHPATFGEDGLEDKETWRVKHMCRSMGSEIYDMAWSPDGAFFITGSMDNIARIYNAQTGNCVRQIAEHSHYVQGVAWDPLNEYVATQSSDRSVHIYTLKNKDGHFSLAQHSKVSKMDLPARRISSNSPAPPDFGGRASFPTHESTLAIGSPVPSAPGTPNSLALPMNPPPMSHSRRSSFGSSPSMRRSVSPAPSMPLPAVMPNSPSISNLGVGVRNAPIYANETFTSFFRRLTFAPDGSLLFTPAGQYKTLHPSLSELAKGSDDIINTVYIYTRAGLNKPPIAYLPGHKKPSVAVRCSPIYYTLRQPILTTKQITIDTTSAEDEIPALPEPALPSKLPPSNSAMDPPPLTSAPSPSPSMTAGSPRPYDSDAATPGSVPSGPPSAFNLPYRMVYAVATQDAIHVYDTQQQKPLCVVSNLHFSTFTDLSWSNDGLTLLMSSSDGFCSALTFAPGELGQVYHGPMPSQAKHHHTPSSINTANAASSNNSTPTPTPTSASIPTSVTPGAVPMQKQPSAGFPASPSSFAPARPGSPTRSNSVSSVATISSLQASGTGGASGVAPSPGGSVTIDHGVVLNHSTPVMSTVPSVAATNSSTVGGMPMWTPPMTPAQGGGNTHSASSSVSGFVGGAPWVDGTSISALDNSRRESESERSGRAESVASSVKRNADAIPTTEDRAGKRRRVAPTLVSNGGMEHDGGAPPPSE
ncbi:WD40 repeat-like protein [Mytilinidion resinicola]|uniref:WD40 repeat-like protein n=1 Tax=Mytilinidion resinicola TaxID=574789 RepID=A0A6A6Z2Q5_9PEZI|nr:WD40 repeat-like protein [Mytilinidion resinicola]KAF2815386.1 WD40 repeat-like protein [Mytilinidion resinicola]